MGAKPTGPESRAWRPDLAYVVGLLATDGNLANDGRVVTVVSRDLALLQTVASILEVNGGISPHRGQFPVVHRLQISYRLFHGWLAGIGITPRKTHTIGSISVPDEYVRDFLRGHLDGDGSITTYVDRYQARLKPTCVYQRLYVRFLSASLIRAIAKPFLTGELRAFRHPIGYTPPRAGDGCALV